MPCFYSVMMLCPIPVFFAAFMERLHVELQPQCSNVSEQIVEWKKESIFLEKQHYLLKFNKTEVGWQACGYLRRR